MLKQTRSWLIILLATAAVGFVAVVGFLRIKQDQDRIGSIVSLLTYEPETPALGSASPSPFPFEELTIPYLRQREYQSQLGELQKMGENAVYTSYLASYDSDGLTVYGLLTQPKGEPPPGGWPAIVFVHGYIPPAQYQTQVNYVSYVDFLARSGLVVFKIDLRGHGNSQGDPGGAYYSSDYVIDTLNARAALSSSDFVNPEKIGLWGHSMAGNVVLRSFAARPKIPAVVVWAGAGYTYTDLLEYRLRDASYRPPVTDTQRQRRRQELREAYGEFDPQDAFWRRVAVTDYLPDLKGALQLHHAVDDAVVSIEYSRNLVNRLDKTDVVHELFEYPGGGHNLTGSSFTQAMERTAAFFDAHLGE